MTKFFMYLKGYLNVEITSNEPERFFNICNAKSIIIYNIHVCKNTYIFDIGIDDFYKLKSIVKKTKTKVRILKKKGYPFFVSKNKKRKTFFAGIILFVLIIQILSVFVWDIHFEGMYTYTEDAMLKYLAEKNIKQGVLKSDIDCDEIEKLLRKDFLDITWVSVSLDGTRLKIHIKENSDYDIIAEKDYNMSDIVAKKDGRIVSIITRSGTPLVKQGDIVKANDILVSGNVVVKDEYGELIKQEYGNADADILAEIVYNYIDELPIRREIKKYSGKKKESFGISVLDKKIFLFSSKVKYDYFERTVSQKQLKIGEDLYLPIYFYEISYDEYTSKFIKYTKEEAENILQKNIDYFFEELIEKGVQIIENNVTIRREGTTYVAEGDIVVIEELGINVSVEDLYQGNNQIK